METVKNYLKVSLKDGSFEIGGSDEFISNNLEKVFSFLETSQNSTYYNDDEQQAENANQPGPEEAPITTPEKTKPYKKSLHFENNEVKIIQKMPGSNKAQKSVNTALVYLWGMKHIGINEVPYSEIRELCKNQGCLDSPNFSRHMNSARQEIIVSGRSGSPSKTCKLTIPGVEKAKEILESLE
ncbi:hypothetical protein [Marispirochaeta aestuarii]|uniref:hypothetical protein n=1 Tax=Marispirochaeta aestuarii TaxID=1963862 RepID=UPI002ABE51BD|nr:hypothetical protein [Marispirochaeta aestuarii]